MVIAKLYFCRGRDAGSSYLPEKLVRARDAAEGNRTWRGIRENEFALCSPDRLLLERSMIRGQARGQYDYVRARKGREGLAQPSGWQQSVIEIALGHKHNVEVSRQRAVLKTIVEDVQLGMESLLGNPAGLITPSTNYYGNTQPPRDQQWLVPEFGGGAIGLYHEDAARFAAISAREHIEVNATSF
jgi:hypothetical protein